MSGNPAKIGLGAFLASILVSAYLMTVPRIPPYAGSGESRVRDAIGQMPIDTEAEARIGQLAPRLAELGRPSGAAPAALDLAVLGYRRIVTPAPAPEPVPERVPEPFDYLVSMTYVSDDRRFAVIDGRFYRERSRLPGGERLLAISPSAVQIQRRDMTRWLEIQKEPDAVTRQGGIIRTDTPELGDGAENAATRPVPQPFEG